MVLIAAPSYIFWNYLLDRKGLKIRLTAVFSATIFTTIFSLVHAYAIFQDLGLLEFMLAVIEVSCTAQRLADHSPDRSPTGRCEFDRDQFVCYHELGLQPRGQGRSSRNDNAHWEDRNRYIRLAADAFAPARFYDLRRRRRARNYSHDCSRERSFILQRGGSSCEDCKLQYRRGKCGSERSQEWVRWSVGALGMCRRALCFVDIYRIGGG
jgi:hypothetical protein